jgi:hypothetical protein
MAGDKQTSRTQIIVAIIGLLGVLGGAMIANWDKIFSPKPPGPGDIQLPNAIAMVWDKTSWDKSQWQ